MCVRPLKAVRCDRVWCLPWACSPFAQGVCTFSLPVCASALRVCKFRQLEWRCCCPRCGKIISGMTLFCSDKKRTGIRLWSVIPVFCLFICSSQDIRSFRGTPVCGVGQACVFCLEDDVCSCSASLSVRQ